MPIKKRVTGLIAGAAATAAIPAGFGLLNWKVLAASAAIGGLGGFFGLDVARILRQKIPRKPPRAR